jgi:hypothetical protein
MKYSTDEEFIRVWQELKSATKVAEFFKQDVRSVYTRRKSMEEKYKISLDASNRNFKPTRLVTPGNMRRELNIDFGMVVVFSDAHFWPDEPTPAYRALLKFLEMHKQDIVCVVNNGDAFDGASISRFPSINFNKLPTVKEELEACQISLTEIENRVLKQTLLIWPMGNHDARYEQLIVNKAPELQGLKGTQLRDYFPLWQPCYSFWVNGDTVIKHRYKGGAMAGRNNTLHGGTNFVTGHTHVGCVNPFTDYNGTRYGVQTGTLANPLGRQFEYAEDSPKDWMACFAVLTFYDGKLLMPELCKVWDDDHFEFRGEVHESHS